MENEYIYYIQINHKSQTNIILNIILISINIAHMSTLLQINKTIDKQTLDLRGQPLLMTKNNKN